MSDQYGNPSPNSPFGPPDPHGLHGLSPQVETLQTPPAPAQSARDAAQPLTDQLSEEDYRRSGQPESPDRYIDDQDAHVGFYLGVQGPPAYPA